MIKVTTTNVVRSFKSEATATSYCYGLQASGSKFSLTGGSLKFRTRFYRHYMADTKRAVLFARTKTVNASSKSYTATKNAAYWISRIRVVLKDS